MRLIQLWCPAQKKMKLLLNSFMVIYRWEIITLYQRKTETVNKWKSTKIIKFRNTTIYTCHIHNNSAPNLSESKDNYNYQLWSKKQTSINLIGHSSDSRHLMYTENREIFLKCKLSRAGVGPETLNFLQDQRLCQCHWSRTTQWFDIWVTDYWFGK